MGSRPFHQPLLLRCGSISNSAEDGAVAALPPSMASNSIGNKAFHPALPDRNFQAVDHDFEHPPGRLGFEDTRRLVPSMWQLVATYRLQVCHYGLGIAVSQWKTSRAPASPDPHHRLFLLRWHQRGLVLASKESLLSFDEQWLCIVRRDIQSLTYRCGVCRAV